MDRKDALEYVKKIFDIIEIEGVLIPENSPVINFKHPHELLDGLLDLNLGEPTRSKENFLQEIKKIINYSVKTCHKHFYNQLYGGVDLYGFAGTLLAESLNTNQHTFEVSPVFTLIEQEVIKKFANVVGYKNYDGIFCPGGSIANMYGIMLARYLKYPEIKEKGLFGCKKLIIFVSEEGHYSITKSANWLGFGTENVKKIKTDKNGRMCVKDLEENILNCSESEDKLVVIATAGTTIYGAIDPIDKIQEICKQYNIWMHVDASYGGILLLSKNHKSKLKNIQNVDSLVWNSHKMLGVPLQCSLFLTKHSNLLMDCNSASAKYLFQSDKMYDTSFDTGDKSIQCGRKVDAFKLWTTWKLRGDQGLEKLVDTAVDCSNYFKNSIQNKEGFRLINENVDTTSICFFYIPKILRNVTEDDEWKLKLNLVAPSIKSKLVLSGDLMISYTPMASKGLCNFFRLVVTCHPPRNYEDMDYIIEQIENVGEKFTL
ncbi:glutamate decarboxylase 1-like [Onthophagus taurus]|uniref:glutamate decarboxylase 1-like n=1 Tax=Onthophagus taurus TaxID=166361 RepID=UPI0039BE565E